MSGVSEPNLLVIQSVNVNHTCSVAKHYETYHEVRALIPSEEQATIAQLINFRVTAGDIAIYLRDKGLSNITLKDIRNLCSRLRQSVNPKDENEVLMFTFVDVFGCLHYF